MKRTWIKSEDRTSSLMRRLLEAEQAIRERKFRPIHAADLLEAAETREDHAAAVAKIVRLVASGFEGRMRDVQVSDLRGGSLAGRGGRASRARSRRAGQAC